MENRAHAIAAGVFVAALALLLLLLAGWLTRERGPRDAIEISTRQPLTGLQQQAPVRLRGVDVGKVSRIAFDPKVPGNVLLRLEVDEETPLAADTFATLSYQGVTGLAFIQLNDRGGGGRLAMNDEAPPRIPLEAGFVAKLEERGEAILDKVEQASTQLTRLLSDDNQKRLAQAIGSMGQAADSANKLAQNLDSTVTKRLDPTLEQASAAIRSAGRSAEEVGRTAAEFRTTARRLNEKGGPIDRLGEGTDALSAAAENFNVTTLPRLNRTAEEATQTLRQVRRTVNDLEDNPQQLIYGDGRAAPGPGEPGFQPPGGAR
jgi:phospholipid/cholesterol/gamma-HCH transport system substrate-binding protein